MTNLRDDSQRYRRSGTPTGMVIFVVVLAIFIIGGGAGLIYWSNNRPSTAQETQSHADLMGTASVSLSATADANATATAIANINPYVLDQSTLVINDPLNMNNPTLQWSQDAQGNCQFTNGSYHALAMPNLFTTCLATGTNFTDFTYEIQMLFIKNAPKYTSGGILFRGSSNQQKFYFFEVYASGRYLFQKCITVGNCTILAGSAVDPPVPAYHVGQANTLAVVAKQNTFTFYINHQLVGSMQTDKNNPYIQGMVGVLARGGLQTTISTEMAYSHIKVWQ